MAHAIIFTDLGPRTRDHDFTSQLYSYPAGAYKIASVLRDMGLAVVVVPNSSNLSLKGVKTIIDRNSRDLLWVGVSTSLFVLETDEQLLKDYRVEWSSTDSLFVDADRLCIKIETNTQDRYRLFWETRQLGLIAQHLQSKHTVPLLVGGVWAQSLLSDPLKHKNMHVILSYAESYIKELTEARLNDKKADLPLVNNNNEYDTKNFKESKIIWTAEDFISFEDWLPLEVSRGCAFNCAYCSHVRRGELEAFKKPRVLYDELMRNYETFGVTRYLLVDDLYNDTTEKVERLYDEVWSRLPFRPEWTSHMRLDLLWNRPKNAEILTASGCRYASFGIETLHDVAGRKVGKGLGKRRIIETLEMLRSIWGNETLVGAYMIAGLPYEPYESIKDSVEWSITTDLIHSPHWNPLGVQPPMYVESSQFASKIDQQPDKFGFRWITPDNWINSAGVTKHMADELCKDYSARMSSANFRFSYSSYVDVRLAGFTHEEIANFKKVPLDAEKLAHGMRYHRQKIQTRLERIMDLST